MIFDLILWIIGYPCFLWVLDSILRATANTKFNKHFFIQTLSCWKCLTFWITLLITILVTKELLYSLCLASIVSYIAFRLDKKINRDKDNNIKLW